jgi:hypothetical protein
VHRFVSVGAGAGSSETPFVSRSSLMEDIVHLGDTSQPAASELPFHVDCEYGSEYADTEVHVEPAPSSARGGSRVRGRSSAARSVSSASLSQAAHPQKVRGPNWTEAEMLVLIAQKCLEWDGRHNCNQPALAKFVYGATAWKLVLAGCNAVVGCRARDVDQITNKWDGLIKDYKKLKEYIDGTGSGNWWGMTRDDKKQLSRTRKMPHEFSESMYVEMEGFIGKRQIFGRASDAVDSDRVPPTTPRRFGRSPSSPCTPSAAGVQSPMGSATTTSESPTGGTPGDDIPGSTGRKRKATGTENLVDFVKDFNSEYIARVDAQDKDKHAWRSRMFAFDTAREARIALKDTEAINLDHKLYELEVERTKNLGNMTSALLMLASSMDALTRFSTLPFYILLYPTINFCASSFESPHVSHFECAQGSPVCPLWPFGLPTRPSPHSQGPLALGDGNLPLRLGVSCREHPLVVDCSPVIFDPAYGPCWQARCCVKHNTHV